MVFVCWLSPSLPVNAICTTLSTGMLSHLNQRPVSAVASALQKEASEAALAAALAALERHQARLSNPMPAATGNASSCAQDRAETPPSLDLTAPAELMEAQQALVAADEQARSSKQAFQNAARLASQELL